MKTSPLVLAVCAAFLVVGGQNANAVEQIANGGFEAGTFAGWTVVDQAGGSGSFFVESSPMTPLNGFPTAGPASGTFYAVTDQSGPGAHALLQTFVVPAGSLVILNFAMFVNDQSGVGPIVNPAGLDYTASPNQHARVDILTAGASALSTAPADVLGNFYLGVDPGANPHGYSPYSFDLTALLGAGGTFQLRFAEVDNQFFLNQGVDNVSIDTQAAGAGVPEGGATGLLLIMAVVIMAGIRKAGALQTA